MALGLIQHIYKDTDVRFSTSKQVTNHANVNAKNKKGRTPKDMASDVQTLAAF
jgi:hypothetical protein